VLERGGVHETVVQAVIQPDEAAAIHVTEPEDLLAATTPFP
jgi:hypothetical protein